MSFEKCEERVPVELLANARHIFFHTVQKRLVEEDFLNFIDGLFRFFLQHDAQMIFFDEFAVFDLLFQERFADEQGNLGIDRFEDGDSTRLRNHQVSFSHELVHPVRISEDRDIAIFTRQLFI